MINDILDMAKIEAGQMQIERENVDLVPLLEETMRLLAIQAESKGIEVQQKIPADLSLTADRRAMKQILLNLLSNAVKFTDPGGRILVRARKTSTAVTLTIEDTGIGIPKALLGRIGQPFEQVQNQFSKSTGGSGLGLAISRSLAELHGGAMKVRSTEGVGTIVSVRGAAGGPGESAWPPNRRADAPCSAAVVDQAVDEFEFREDHVGEHEGIESSPSPIDRFMAFIATVSGTHASIIGRNSTAP